MRPSGTIRSGESRPARFTGIVLSGHKEDAVEVPFDPASRWNVTTAHIRVGRRGYRVTACINGCRFDSHVVARSGRFWLLLPAQVERDAGFGAGDTVSVVLSPAA